MKMPDQTSREISQVIEKNSVKRYNNRTQEMFSKWLEKCPVEYDETLREGYDGIITINFHIKERR